jgi:hypothetical protein
MFDTTPNITIELRATGGKTEVTVRWPTDEEWDLHRRRRRVLLKQLGRGAQETEIDSGDADARLYETIKLNGAPPLSPGESSVVIEAIGRCNILNVDLGEAEAEVTLQILTGEVKHTVRIPTMDEAKKLEKTTRHITLPYGRIEARTSLAAGAALWDACHGKADGYAGAVSALHKDAVIRGVIQAIEQETRTNYDEGNF